MLRGCKNGTDLLYHHANYVGDRGSCAGCIRKSVMFLSFLFFYVTLWNYEVCDNGNAMKQCNFENNYAPIFKFLYGPPGFFLGGKFIPKIAIFGDFGGRKATF